MPDQLTERLGLLARNPDPALLTGIQRGIEKESLRVTADGHLAQTPHPRELGSALTHPFITTDFSESLLEFITPVSTDIESSLAFLDDIHRFAYPHLDGEQLWTASMPCSLAGDSSIPIAQYGSSNIAKMKSTYRMGLSYRYGRIMQTIAGIHYNFSVPEKLWDALQRLDCDSRPARDYITDSYFKLIRNFRRYSWLLIYLYGASPAASNSFLNGRTHQLEAFDANSVYLPYGTAMRMGDLGYQSSAQSNLNICYNSIDSYIDTLHAAIRNTHPDYEKIGVNVDGQYRQLSTALLQIENEFYSPIRPKRVVHSAETPLGALQERGVEYIEVRCIDVNPYLPLGIDADQIRFLDSFLLYCLFERSPICDEEETALLGRNMKAIVNAGRSPELILHNRDGAISVAEWGHKLLDRIEAIAAHLDRVHEVEDYQRVCRQQREKLDNPRLTPSATILADMRAQDQSWFQFAQDLAQKHTQYFLSRPLADERQHFFTAESERSLYQQRDIEETDTQSFDEFLSAYYHQYDALN